MSAIISDDGLYRYRLERELSGSDDTTVIIMVNPSTADATANDATIRKLIGFGQRNDWGRIIVGNLFAYRATDVRELGKIADPVGPDNDRYLSAMMAEADRVIYAWGPVAKQPKFWRRRWRTVDDIVRSAGHMSLSIGEPAKCGHPRHPLMLAYVEPIQEWKSV